MGACPVAPHVGPDRTDAEGWERYLHALVTRCDTVWLVMLDGWEDNADVARVRAWARQHALRVLPQAPPLP